jgi:cell division protein FtsB
MYTPNYGSLHKSNINIVGADISFANMTFGGTTYSNMVKNGIWVVKEVYKIEVGPINNGNFGARFGLIDNYGNLWTGGAGGQYLLGGCRIDFTKIKDGLGQMPDEVIDTIQKMNTNLGLNIETIYPIIMLCAQQAMGWAQLKNEHSKIKDIEEKLTTENAELKKNVTELSNENDELMDIEEKLTTENAELKQNVKDLSNENDKLMDVNHNNRWLIVF